MNPRLGIWLRRAAVALAVLAILYFAHDPIGQLAARTVALSTFLVNVLLPPALFLVLGWFVYTIWLKKYLRARRISRIRNARYLREAIERGEERN